MRVPIIFDHTHECSAWLRGVENARLADLAAALVACEEDPPDGGSRDLDTALSRCGPYEIVMPLSGRTHPEGSREDRECDRCGHYIPIGQDLYPIISYPRQGVRLVGGLCSACIALEVGR